jgi:hypothetical protein
MIAARLMSARARARRPSAGCDVVRRDRQRRPAIVLADRTALIADADLPRFWEGKLRSSVVGASKCSAGSGRGGPATGVASVSIRACAVMAGLLDAHRCRDRPTDAGLIVEMEYV